MSEFTSEELFDTIESRIKALLLEEAITSPPVNTLELVQSRFGYRVSIADDEHDQFEMQPSQSRRRRPRPKELQFTAMASTENQHLASARAIAREILPGILAKLGVVNGMEQKAAVNQLVALIAPRILLPSRWFETVARKSSQDILRIKETFSNVNPEMIGLRLLDFEEPCVIAIVDDHIVTVRRSNCMSVNKTLTPAEQHCVDRVAESDDPVSVRREGWSAWGWPISGSQFRRILVRSVPDEL